MENEREVDTAVDTVCKSMKNLRGNNMKLFLFK